MLASVSLRRWKSSRDKLAPTGGIRCLYLAPVAPGSPDPPTLCRSELARERFVAALEELARQARSYGGIRCLYLAPAAPGSPEPPTLCRSELARERFVAALEELARQARSYGGDSLFVSGPGSPR